MEHDKITLKTSCRSCGHTPFVPVLSLGELYISDFLDHGKEHLARKAPLEIVLCESCGLLQTKHTVSHESLYRNYWYRSGMNKTMMDELADITSKAEQIVDLRPGDFVVDIGSNDGTLLRSYRATDINLVGFEPARNIVEKYGRKGIHKVFANFFNHAEWEKEFGTKRSKIITAIAMFYDLDDPNAFVADVSKSLDEDGLFIIQMSYLPYSLERNAFDGICHEHLKYYSLFSLENLLKKHHFEVFDVELRDINEGSFRIYIKHRDGGKTLRIPEGGGKRIEQMRMEEKKLGLNTREVYDRFLERVNKIKNDLRHFIEREVKLGKKVYAYGASTKGNTLLQFFGLNHTLITAAAERNPDKWGKRTVGTLIPIVSEEEARRAKPDYFLVLPWHFLKEFRERERAYLDQGGKFIVPLPEFRIIGSND